MATEIKIKHATSGMVKSGYYGFSWTYLFFGWLVPLIRGELGIAALHIVFTFFTLGLWQLIFAFMYNKSYMERKLTGGFALAGSESENNAAGMALGISATT